jgi:hypothetical protein
MFLLHSVQVTGGAISANRTLGPLIPAMDGPGGAEVAADRRATAFDGSVECAEGSLASLR